MDSFVYCWTDRTTNKLYVGAHKGSPDDGYVCSSKLMKQEYTKRPDEFTRSIIARGTYAEMVAFETSILRSVDAKRDPLFYNGHNGDGKFHCKGHTDTTKEKMSASRKSRTRQPNAGMKFSDTHRANLSSSLKGKPWADGQFEKMAGSWKIIHPSGNEELIVGLTAFCREHNLSQPHMSMVASGKRIHHKGYRCEKLVAREN